MIFIQGLKLYYNAKLVESITKFEAAIKLDPDFKKAQERRNNAKKMIFMASTGKKSIDCYVLDKVYLYLQARNFTRPTISLVQLSFTLQHWQLILPIKSSVL